MAFAKEMLEIKRELEKNGHKIIIPINTEKYTKKVSSRENKKEKIQLDVIRDYFKKIKKADAILLINKDKNGIKNYIGGNGLIEMAFAYILNKKIFLLNPIPKISYADEIEAVKPIIINGNLESIDHKNRINR